MSVLDQLKKLDEQRAKLLDGAKEEALGKAKAAIAELNELGFSYKLVQGDGTLLVTRVIHREPPARKAEPNITLSEWARTWAGSMKSMPCRRAVLSRSASN